MGKRSGGSAAARRSAGHRRRGRGSGLGALVQRMDKRVEKAVLREDPRALQKRRRQKELNRAKAAKDRARGETRRLARSIIAQDTDWAAALSMSRFEETSTNTLAGGRPVGLQTAQDLRRARERQAEEEQLAEEQRRKEAEAKEKAEREEEEAEREREAKQKRDKKQKKKQKRAAAMQKLSFAFEDE